MSTAIRSSLTDHSTLDGTGDEINGSEVDENGFTVADILDGTTSTDLAGAGTVDFVFTTSRSGLRLIDLDNAASAIHTALTVEWDPGDGGNLTDNGSGIGIDFIMPDDADNQDTYASINTMVVSDATTAEEGELSFKVAKAGTNTEVLTIGSGVSTFSQKVTVGVNDTGHDVKFFGATAGAYMEWDESADQLRIMGASADATTSTGKLLLATSLDNINANDVLGKIDFQAPHEDTGTDAIAIAASIEAIAQATFTATVNATDLIFSTGSSGAASEKFRFTSDGELGVGGANYGTDGQVLTSTGAGTAPAWEDATAGDITSVVAGNGLTGGATSGAATVTIAAAQTTITSIYATDLIIGEDSETAIDFGTADEIDFKINNTAELTLSATALYPIADAGLDLGTSALGYNDLHLGASGVINFDNANVTITHTTGALTVGGGTLTVGANTDGHDVKFFGNASGAYMEWDESADQLRIMGASADAVTSTGKLLLATSLIDINANDVLGKIDFQAPHEDTGTDAIAIAASIQAVAQATFTATVNATDLIFYTGHSEAATEKFRMTSQGELGVGGANYGTDGQVLTSAGAGAAAAWEDAGAGTSLSGTTNNTVATVTGANALIGEAELTFDGTDLAIGNTAPSSYINSVHGVVVGESDDATSEIVIAGTVGELNFTDTADTTNQASISHSHSTNKLTYDCISGLHEFSFNGAVNARIDQAKLFMYETANAHQSIGATLNQATADNEILTLKSSDVAHGMTDLAETDTYGNWQKHDSTGGGCTWVGYTETTAAINIIGRTSDNSTLKSTSARGCIETYSQTKSGTSVAAMGTDANLFVMRNASTTRFIFDAEGSGHADVEWTTFSDARLKKNIVDCPYGLAEVLQLEPKAFDKHSGKIEDGEVVLEENSRRMIGFLAQDVKALMPELVKDLPDDESFYSLNDGKLAAVLVNAIQELNAKLEAN